MLAVVNPVFAGRYEVVVVVLELDYKTQEDLVSTVTLFRLPRHYILVMSHSKL